MASIADIRKQYPEYSDVDDGTLAAAFHRNFYSDMPFENFAKAIGYSGPASRWATAGKSFAGGLGEGLLGTVEGPFILKNYVQGTDPKQDSVLQQASALREKMHETLAVDPAQSQEFIAGTLPQAAGSMVSFFLPAGVFGKGLKLAGAAPGLVNTATTLMSSALGASQSGAAGFRDALVNGASLENAYKASGLNALVGLSEGVPIARALDRLDQGTGGSIKRLIVEGLKGGGEEAIQEIFQGLSENKIAQELYAPDRSLTEGVLESGAAGGLLGFGLSAATTGIGGRQAARQKALYEQEQAAREAVQAPAPAPELPSAEPPPGIPLDPREFREPATGPLQGVPEPPPSAPMPGILVPPDEYQPVPAPAQPPPGIPSEPPPPPGEYESLWERQVPAPLSPMAQAMAQSQAEQQLAGAPPIPVGNWDQVTRPLQPERVSPMAAAMAGGPFVQPQGFPMPQRVTPVVQTVIPEPDTGPLAAALAQNEAIVRANLLGRQLAEQQSIQGEKLAEAEFVQPLTEFVQPAVPIQAPTVAVKTPAIPTTTPTVTETITAPTVRPLTEFVQPKAPASLPETPAAIPGSVPPLTITDFNAALKADPSLGSNPQFIAGMRAAMAAQKAAKPVVARPTPVGETQAPLPVTGETQKPAKLAKPTELKPAADKPAQEPAAEPTGQIATRPSAPLAEMPAEVVKLKHAPVVAAPKPAKAKSGDRLRDVARRTIERVDEELGRDRLANTARRQRIAGNVTERLSAEKQAAETLDRIADRIDDGETGPVSKISSIKDVERLRDALSQARYNRWRKENTPYSKQDKFASYTVDDAKTAVYRNAPLLAKLGVTDTPSLRKVLSEFVDVLAAKKRTVDPIRTRIQEAARMNIPGYFPTPKPLIDEVIAKADIKPGMRVLEPEAGTGDLALAAKEAGGEVDTAEISSTLSAILKDRGLEPVASDLMKMEGESYDRIVMNPPFERGQDMEHVRKAYELLRPGGRVVAIMSEGPFFRQDKKSTEFREWLDSVDGESEKNPEGSFKTADRATGVATRTVVIDKPDVQYAVAPATYETPGSPEYRAAVAKGLDMSQAARMQRAREMGFDVETPLYHGTVNSFDEFDVGRTGDIGVHLGTAEQAGTFAKNPWSGSTRDGAQVMPVVARMEKSLRVPDEFSTLGKQFISRAKMLTLDTRGFKASDVERSAIYDAAKRADAARRRGGGDWSIVLDKSKAKHKAAYEAASKEFWGTVDSSLKRQGYDSLVYSNRAEGPGDSYVILDPRNIRSTQAAFDPANADSANLLAAVGEHASDYIFDRFDFRRLGENTQSNITEKGLDNWAMRLARFGAWLSEDGSKVSDRTLMKNILQFDIPDPSMHFDSLDELAEFIKENGGPTKTRRMLRNDGHDVVSVDDEEFGVKSLILLDPRKATRIADALLALQQSAFTPAFARDRSAIVAEATKLAKQINPAVTLEAVDRILDISPAAFAASGGREGFEPIASYSPAQGLIRVALSLDDKALLSTVGHEAWHSIERMLPARDAALLIKAFPASGTRAQNEEVAYAFGDYLAGKPRGNLAARGVFARIKQFLQRLGNLLRGRGFQTVDDVFERALAGDYAPKLQTVDVRGTPVWGMPLGKEGAAISAWHGSPHRFDKFDFSKIGTGEGAQAYGHGGYYADVPDVAKGYKPDAEARYARSSGHLTPKQEFAYDLANQGQSEFDIIQAIARKYDGIGFDEAESLAKEAVSKTNSGALYKVTLDVNPEDLLDWDKPRSEQSQKVREALEKAGLVPGGQERAEYLASLPAAAKPIAERLMDHAGEVTGSRFADDWAQLDRLAPDIDHNVIHDVRRVEPVNGSDLYRSFGDQEEASAALLSAGIPGIKYLDGTSRKAGEGTYNYVIFDDKLVNIDDVQYAVAPVDRPEWMYDSEPADTMGRIKDATFGSTYRKARDWWMNDGITQLVDRFQPVLQLGRRLMPTDPGFMHRLTEFAANDAGAIQATMEAGAPVYDKAEMVMKLKPGSKGLVEIMTKHLLGETNTDERQRDAYRAGAYRIGQRAQRLKAEGRENLLSNADIAKALDVTPDEKKRYDAMWKEYDAHNNAVLQFLVDTGVIKQDAKDQWAAYGDYVPFYRVMEEDGELIGPAEYRSGISNPDPKIKKLKGGTSKLGDPFENIARNEKALISSGRRNIALREIAKTMIDAGEARFVPVTGGDTKNTILVYEEGQKKRLQVDDPAVAASLLSLGPQQTNGILQLLQKFAQIYRAGVTLSPSFAIANMLRDTPSAFIQTGANVTLKNNPFSNLAAAYNGSPELSQLRAITGYGGTVYGSEGRFFEPSLAEVVGTKRVGKLKQRARQTHDFLENVSQTGEWAGRMAIYKNMVDRGETEADAAYEAMNVINFSRHGASPALRALTQMVPFLNARIVGLARMFETQGAKFGSAERTKLLKGLALRGAILTAATAAIFSTYDDDDWERYNEESIARRANYHILYGPDGGELLIPKAFEFGTLFSTLPEALYRAIAENHPGELGKMLKHTIGNTFSFNPTPQAMKPALEVLTNYNMFQDRELEPGYLKRFMPEERSLPNTSPIAQGIAKALPGGLSPIQVQHLIEGYTGAMGAAFLFGMDGLASAMGLTPERPTGAFGSFPGRGVVESVLGRFVKSGDIKPAEVSIQRLYELKEKADQAYTTARELMRRGEADRAKEIMEENKAPLMLRKQLDRAADDLAKYTKLARQVRYNRAMNADEKKARIDELTNQKNAIARRYMAMIDRVAA